MNDPLDANIGSVYGGPIPSHSQHWADWFEHRNANPQPIAGPDPASLHRAVTAAPNHMTGGDGSGMLPMYSGIRHFVGGQGRMGR